MKTSIFSKIGQKFGGESISFLKNFLPSLKILGAPPGRIDVLAGTPRTTQPSCPILKNENITGRVLPCTVEHLDRTSDIMVTGCGVSKGNALRLRLTGSVVQPMSCYDLLTYQAIGSNYLSFVVTSMLVFHIAIG